MNSELLAKAEQERASKLAKKAEHDAYYPERLTELNLTSMDRFVDYHPDPSPAMINGRTFAHRDLESVAQAMADETPWAVVSGLNPSGPLHYGHKQVFEEVLWFQQQGAEVFIPITDDETYLVGKKPTLAEARRIAIDDVMPSIAALGFDPDRTHMFIDTDYPDIYNAATHFARELPLRRVFGVFGFSDNLEGENAGTVFYRGGTQIAHILLPQLDEFQGPKPTVIPVGIDQYPYIQLARDVAEAKGLTPPAATFSTFLEGLDGKGKMSASRVGSPLFLTDEPTVAEKKIKGAYTGGSVLADFQREHGGIPDICPIYQLRTSDGSNPDLHDACANGQILCGSCKKEAIGEVSLFLREHAQAREAVVDHLDDYILTTPLASILSQ